MTRRGVPKIRARYSCVTSAPKSSKVQRVFSYHTDMKIIQKAECKMQNYFSHSPTKTPSQNSARVRKVGHFFKTNHYSTCISLKIYIFLVFLLREDFHQPTYYELFWFVLSTIFFHSHADIPSNILHNGLRLH